MTKKKHKQRAKLRVVRRGVDDRHALVAFVELRGADLYIGTGNRSQPATKMREPTRQ